MRTLWDVLLTEIRSGKTLGDPQREEAIRVLHLWETFQPIFEYAHSSKKALGR